LEAAKPRWGGKVEIIEILKGVLVFMFGATVGSFLNVVIHRLPQDQSIISPRSRCPDCGNPIRWYDNIPILSFFILKMRCRGCGQMISFRYPLVEFITAALAMGLWWKFGLSKGLAVHFVFSAALIAVTFIDIDHRIIPNEISLPGILIAFGCSFMWEGHWKDSLIGLLAGGGGLLLLSLLYSLIRGREGMGMGDVKLLAMLGAWLGWRCLLFVLLFASVQGVVVSVALWLSGVKLKPPLPEEWEEEEQKEKSAAEEAPQEPQESEEPEEATGFMVAAIPFGPFLALSAIEYLFLAEWFYGLIRGGGT
jgi:leader peptidase (prepilin peptidase)/N-methyltransferase